MAKKSVNESAAVTDTADAAPATAQTQLPQVDNAAASAKIVWDDSAMRTSYANVCNILGTREEITLLFGSNQTWLIGQDQMRVKLTDRIVINPYMAKRLLDMLSKGINEYESRFGSLSS